MTDPKFAQDSLPATEQAAPAPAPDPLPSSLDLNALQRMPLAALTKVAAQVNARNFPPRPRHPLIAEVCRAALNRQVPICAEGVLEMGAEPFGHLRWPQFNFLPLPEDVHVSPALIRQHGLRAGHLVRGWLRPAREQEKFIALDRVTHIEGVPVEEWTAPKEFDKLTPLFPNERIILESPAYHDPTVRAIDLVSTLGRGQRGLILRRRALAKR